MHDYADVNINEKSRKFATHEDAIHYLYALIGKTLVYWLRDGGDNEDLPVYPDDVIVLRLYKNGHPTEYHSGPPVASKILKTHKPKKLHIEGYGFSSIIEYLCNMQFRDIESIERVSDGE